MAEELTRNRQALKLTKLTTCQKSIRQALDQAMDTSPTEKFLTRQVTHLREAWDEYEEHTLQLMEVRSAEKSQGYREAFDKGLKEFEEVRQLAEAFMERFQEPEEPE